MNGLPRGWFHFRPVMASVLAQVLFLLQLGPTIVLAPSLLQYTI